MKINCIAGATRNPGAPPNWDPSWPPCVGLPIRDDEVDGVPCMVSSWQPTPEEIGRILCGAPVELWMAGKTPVPVSIQVGAPTQVSVPE